MSEKKREKRKREKNKRYRKFLSETPTVVATKDGQRVQRGQSTPYFMGRNLRTRGDGDL